MTLLLVIMVVACYVYFVAGICGSLLSFYAQKLFGPSTLFSHGKAATSSSINKHCSWITKLTVSKHLFWHFYAFGLLSSIAYNCFRVSASIPAILLAVQCFRRMLECFWVMPGGARGSQMHLIHYLIGISYYPVLLLSFNFQDDYKSKFYYPWITLFIVTSGFQCYCHWILGSSRRNLVERGTHRPLNNFIFKYIHTPHYFAELLIYTSIAGLFRFEPLSILNLIWIISILGVSAKNSADWLCDTWKYKSYKEFCKYLMIPFLF